MCGITGIVAKDSIKYQKLLNKAVLSLKHRGPDANGTYFFNNCALGHTRLSIVDLSTGAQPMLLDDNRLGITFNGEIYGYKDIKKEISNYNFTTTSDTEVILALYEKHGENMLDKLPGMFAFAIWDERKQRLFCARDRFGEKPFYYALGPNNELIFASEIKAILATGLIKPILNVNSVTHYLKHLYVNPNETIYKNVFILPPAHLLLFENEKIITKKYWDLPAVNNKITLTEAEETFRLLLEKAVAKQMVADVPVGAFLSGGLDSSTIIVEASKLKKDLQTISFGFGESINELPYAKLVSDKFKTQHIEIKAENYNLADLFIKMQEIYDEPFADSSNIPTYLISESAKKYGKVVLTGDGGDELFGGYTGWYMPIYFMLQKNPLKFSAVTKDILNIILRNSKEAKNDLYYRLQGLRNKIRRIDPLLAHIKKNTYFSNKELNKILIKKDENNIKGPRNDQNSLDDVMHFDVLNYMPGDILTKTDRASMAASLELRSPFLDVDFATFCLTLPSRLKVDEKQDKIILRKSYKKDWPREIANRRKQGFGAPVCKWLKVPSFIKLKKEYLMNEQKKIFQILNFKECKNIIEKDNYQTWILLTLSAWLEKHDFI